MGQAQISEDDKSALLDIFVWLFLVSSVLGVLVETSTKLVIRRRLAGEDYLIILSLIFAIGQSSSIGVQISNGLGKHRGVLDDTQLNTVLKAEYASNVLFMLCLWFTKLSLIIFIKKVAIIEYYQYTAYGLAILTTLWTVSSVFAVAFQCELPQPWNYMDSTCIDRKAFWIYYGIMNILTDIGPIILMILLASRIHTSMGRKITVGGVFGSRIVVIAAVACQVYYTNRAMPTSDPTFDLWPTWVCTQLVQALAIITTCIPYLKPFMDSLESGGYRADDQRRRGTNGYGSYNHTNSSSNRQGAKSAGSRGFFSSKNSHNNSSNNVSGNRRQRSHAGHSRDNIHELGLMGNLAQMHGVSGARVERSPSNDWEEDRNSESSQSRIIKETKTFTVDVERI